LATDVVTGHVAVGGRVAVPVPAGWADRTVVTLVGPTDGEVQVNVVVTSEVLCDHLGLGAFADGWVRRLADEVEAREVRPVEHRDIAGARAQVRVIRWAAAGVDLTQLVALVCDETHGHAAICTAPTDTFSDHEATFRQVLDGLGLGATPTGPAHRRHDEGEA